MWVIKARVKTDRKIDPDSGSEIDLAFRRARLAAIFGKGYFMASKWTDRRPMAPHLQIWRWHASMLSSILHRASAIICDAVRGFSFNTKKRAELVTQTTLDTECVFSVNIIHVHTE